MNYKETLYFIAKCLTISLEKKNKDEIEFILKTTDLDWDSVVKISTTHYVFPALYCNLKRVNFLHYLPKKLVSYMKYITCLNRERNEKIISQANELNRILLVNKITPIFLKGTGNLIAGIYFDQAEHNKKHFSKSYNFTFYCFFNEFIVAHLLGNLISMVY